MPSNGQFFTVSRQLFLSSLFVLHDFLNDGTADIAFSSKSHPYLHFDTQGNGDKSKEMPIKLLAVLMTILSSLSTMQHIYGAHITEIILDDEPMPAGFGIGVNGGGTSNDGHLTTRDDSVYIISGSNNFAARGTNNGATAAATSATSAAINNNLQNAPFGMLPQQLCSIEIPVVKKYTGHCVRLGKKSKGCVAGEHIIPYHLDCM